MDFYVDLAVAVLLRLIKDRRGRVKYYAALAKVYLALETIEMSDSAFRDLVASKEKPS